MKKIKFSNLNLKANILVKLLAIVIPLTSIGFAILIYQVVEHEEISLLNEKSHTSELMAKPILHTIYKDMLDERAEMTRFLVDGIKLIKGIERVQLIRANGIEEAFQDWKTLDAVEEEYGEVLEEWTDDHPNKKVNIAEGVDNPTFKSFLELFHSGVKTGVSYIEEGEGKRIHTYLIPVEKRPKCKSCHIGEGARAVLMISTSLEDMDAALSASKARWILYGFLTILIVCIILSLLVKKLIATPIKRTADMLHQISEGKGDLTNRLTVHSQDEVGLLSKWFNRFIEGMQDMVTGFIYTANEVHEASINIGKSSKALNDSAKTELEAVETTLVSTKKMDTSIKSVASNAESLMEATEGASASTLQMSAAVSEIAENVQRLAISVGDTASSVSEIASSLKEVSTHVNTLYNETEQVGSAATEIDSTIKEVSEHSRTQAQLAEKVKEEASTVGLDAVEKTKLGIDKIKSEVASTAEVIDRLNKKSKEIGKVVGVIDEVAETTNLLALNATILAAQAGEQGRGFAVVAKEVKSLADRTSASTREIDDLIKFVQDEITVAISSMNRSLDRIDEGAALSDNAGEALTAIITSANESFNMAKKVEGATEEQSRGISMMVKSIHRISTMVEEIKNASEEQSRASTGISKAAEQMQDVTIKVERSTTEQSSEIKHISAVIAEVAEKMQEVSTAVTEQLEASAEIVKSVETIRVKAEENTAHTEELDKNVEGLDAQASLLKEKTENFKV
ncbi:MAG: HAMP domain-containing protein [Deltaproteobacteria bacterium]|nr:HAMP domain-containing protein [Deltaproteobacteria bacterium]